MGLFKNFLLLRALKKGASSSGIEKSADEILLNAVKEMTETSKTARKLLQAKMLRAESRKTLDDIAALGDDDYSEDDDEDEKEFGVSDILKLLGNLPKSQSPQSPTDPYSETPQAPQQKAGLGDLLEMAKTLTPIQKKKLKEKFGIDL